ncbi:lysozyme-like protein 4 [Monodon monoceros]|nr:lysozyme-like protein 4 [Monodon monoceros]
MKVSMVLSLIGYLVVPSGAAVLGCCVVAKKLHEGGLSDFEGYSLENWVCLTAAYDSLRGDYTGYGLFQIRNRDRCDHGKNRCHVSCSALLNPNLKETIECAKKIVSSLTSWTLNCQDSDTLERWLDGCKL